MKTQIIILRYLASEQYPTGAFWDKLLSINKNLYKVSLFPSLQLARSMAEFFPNIFIKNYMFISSFRVGAAKLWSVDWIQYACIMVLGMAQWWQSLFGAAAFYLHSNLCRGLHQAVIPPNGGAEPSGATWSPICKDQRLQHGTVRFCLHFAWDHYAGASHRQYFGALCFRELKAINEYWKIPLAQDDITSLDLKEAISQVILQITQIKIKFQ